MWEKLGLQRLEREVEFMWERKGVHLEIEEDGLRGSSGNERLVDDLINTLGSGRGKNTTREGDRTLPSTWGAPSPQKVDGVP